MKKKEKERESKYVKDQLNKIRKEQERVLKERKK